jgi:hypothetical protein
MRSVLAVPLIVMIFLWLISCEKNTTSIVQQHLMLTKDFAGVTEAWLKVQTGNMELPADFHLIRDDSLVLQGKLNTTDTTLIDTLLQPTHSYNYQLLLYKNSALSALSNELSITTMDTTSHKFQWDSYTFGGYHGSSVFYDVAIIDENNIWAVGEIYGDSLNPQIDYNAIHWDGHQWELKRILYGGNFWTIRTVYAFNENDITFASFIHWDGAHFVEMPIPDVLMGWGSNTIWGTSSHDYYMAGDFGTIAHYNGTTWQKLESGTETRIDDVWGVIDPFSLKQTILAAVSDEYHEGDKRILSLHPTSVNDTLDWNYNHRVMSVWFTYHSNIYVCGSTIRLYRNGRWNLLNLTDYFTNRVRGSSPNNIFIVGAFGVMLHFNGLSWHQYSELMLSTGKLVSLAVHDDMVVAVGYTAQHGYIITGSLIP